MAVIAPSDLMSPDRRPAPSPLLQVGRLTSIAELHALRPEWDELVAAVPDTTIFQTWEWVTSWYEHLGANAALSVLTVRDAGGRLVGVAPWSRASARPAIVRLLHLLGRGNDLTEYVDAILHPTIAEGAARAVFDIWDQRRTQWDVLVLPNVPTDSPFYRAIYRAAQAQRYRLFPVEQAGVARSLPDSWDAFYASLNRNMKKHIKKFANRLQRHGHCAHMVVVDQPEELDAALDTFFDLHRRRAGAEVGRAHTDRFALPERRAFLRTVARRLFERGRFWPCFLYVGERPVAVQLCFTHAGTMYPYYSGYDPDWAWYGVMMNLFRCCIEYAISHGCTALDLMLGMDQEKLRWGGRPRPVVSLALASPRIRSQACFHLYRTRRAATMLIRRVKARPAGRHPAEQGDAGAGEGDAE